MAGHTVLRQPAGNVRRTTCAGPASMSSGRRSRPRTARRRAPCARSLRRRGDASAGVMRRYRPAIVHFFLTEPYLVRRAAGHSRPRTDPDHEPARRQYAPAQMAGGATDRGAPAPAHDRRPRQFVPGGSGSPRRGLRGRTSSASSIMASIERLRCAGRPLHDPRARSALPMTTVAAVMVANLISATRVIRTCSRRWRVPTCRPPDPEIAADRARRRLPADLEREAASSASPTVSHFLGLRQRRPVASWRAADFGVHASHKEGFSNAIIESMAAGLPMVVTDVGGNSEAVIGGEQGFVGAGRTPTGAGRGTRPAGRRPGAARPFRRRGAARASISISRCSACVDRYEALYRGLLTGRRPGGIAEAGARTGLLEAVQRRFADRLSGGASPGPCRRRRSSPSRFQTRRPSPSLPPSRARVSPTRHRPRNAATAPRGPRTVSEIRRRNAQSPSISSLSRAE